MEPFLLGLRAGYPAMLWAAGFTACYLPGYLRLVQHTVEGTRMWHRHWALAVIAAAAAGSVSLAGGWAALSALGVGVLLALRTRPSLTIVAGLVTVRAVWSVLSGEGLGSAVWVGLSLLWGIAAVFSVVWLAGVIRRLAVARAAMATNAVARERARSERELQRTLGDALGSIVTHGERASVQLRAESSVGAHRELETIAREARDTLFAARRIVNEFSHASARSELDAARSLLAAVGLTSTVTASVAQLDGIDDGDRVALRSGVADLLAQSWPRGSVVTIARRDGQLILTVTGPAGDGQ